ncbi:MAG: thioredoxin-disulfide reductase [Clostridia bacterium]
MLDIAIIGGGPAGLSAGLYAARGGTDATLYEELFAGGQAAKTERIDNYPGFPDGLDGYSVGALIEQQATRFGLNISYESVSGLNLTAPEKQILFASGEKVSAKTIILCMGATPRKLGLPEEQRLTGAGISYCATCDGAFFKEKDVAVVGGGDTALSDALYLARFCSSVTVIHRRDSLRAAAALQKAALEDPKIHFLWDSVATALQGETKLTGLTVQNLKTKLDSRSAVSGVFVAVGIMPRTALVKEQLALAGNGSIQTDGRMQTNVPGVFAAGDIRNTPLRQVVTACADGAVAATSALEYLQTL